MVFANLRREERIGLGIAVVLHLALGAAFLVQSSKREAVPAMERMTVNLATDVGLSATAPEPVPESAAAIAPTLAEEPAPVVEPLPAPPPPKPLPRATQAPKPKPTQASNEPRRRPDAPSTRERSTPKPAGGSRIGSDFLPGAGDSTTTRETRVPASQIGASAKASLLQAISNEIRPRWKPPSGPEVDQITTYLRFRLNPDGSLAGAPTFVRQTGVNDVNRPQSDRHRELAIRAVQLAAPFDLPEEYYEAWKVVGPLGFNLEL
ncbi:transport protein TonB [Tsuneonella dongtanensis]|uniref:Transport protein TonB n=1 Tax=Tsuneonella dongtanensis TaxID=692370 RepID=A0A1B2ADI5_9SPHN|nr:energy transducer TonB [Tsuneonella dongtanensis]ANY20194.1 transport protein TonB [Tsuneonella dongtanensis]